MGMLDSLYRAGGTSRKGRCTRGGLSRRGRRNGAKVSLSVAYVIFVRRKYLQTKTVPETGKKGDEETYLAFVIHNHITWW